MNTNSLYKIAITFEEKGERSLSTTKENSYVTPRILFNIFIYHLILFPKQFTDRQKDDNDDRQIDDRIGKNKISLEEMGGKQQHILKAT